MATKIEKMDRSMRNVIIFRAFVLLFCLGPVFAFGQGLDPKKFLSGEYITQVYAIGPLRMSYVDPADDPRNKK